MIEVEDRTDPDWLRHKLRDTLGAIWLYELRWAAFDSREAMAAAGDPWDNPETIGGE